MIFCFSDIIFMTNQHIFPYIVYFLILDDC